ncbi:MAG: hypothetical protein GX444_15590 [Myxococcales bacterium]|nr:hypothetical protein [Myxococcales bacterium]
MKTIVYVVIMTVMMPLILSCVEEEKAENDNNDDLNDDDSESDDDLSDDDIYQEINAFTSIYPETNLEFVGINYNYWDSPSYPYGDGYYDITIRRYSQQKWNNEFLFQSPRNDEVEQIWGFDRNHILMVGRRWEAIGTFIYQTSHLITYGDGSWVIDDKFNYPFVECYGIGGSSRENIYIVANVDKNIDPDITDLDHYIIYHYDGQNIEEILVGESGKTLEGIWVDESGEVYVVGDYKKTSESFDLLLVHYNGTNWGEYTYDNNICHINKIWAASKNDIFLGGYQHTVSNILPIYYPCAYHYNDQNLETISMPDEIGESYFVNNIMGVDRNYVFFSFSSPGDGKKVYLYNGENFINIDLPTQKNSFRLEDMWVSLGGNVYVVGPYEGVMHYNGEKWKQIPGPRLWKIYGFADQGTAGDMIGEEE